MPLILPGNVATALGGVYEVANSCRFDRGSNPTMTKTQSAGDRDKWTFSCWFKLGSTFGAIRYILTSKIDGSNYVTIEMDSADKLRFGVLIAGSYDSFKKTNRVFRDVASWMHLVCVYDSENGTEAHRQRVYINGVEETSWASDNTTTQNQDSAVNDSSSSLIVGNLDGESAWWDGYLAEVCLIDGSALGPTSFGEFDEDSPTIWKPIDVSGLTFGTNGFYLDFEASGNLGNDANGGTDLTEANIAATDQSTDTCTNNFCVGNFLDNYYAASTFTEGNLKIATNAANKTFNTSTFVLTAGKWYFEVRASDTNSDDAAIGIASVLSPQSGANGGELYDSAGNYAYRSGGNKANNDTSASYGDTWNDDNDIIGVALDLDNLKIYFSKNGTFQDSGDPTSGATGTGAAYTITAPGSQTLAGSLDGYTPAFGEEGAQSDVFELNFGNPTFSLSSGNADGNGYGNFEYAPPSGYLSICTKNLGSDGG